MEKASPTAASSIPPLVTQLRRPKRGVHRKRLNRGLARDILVLLKPFKDGLYAATIYDFLKERGLAPAKGMRAVTQALNYLQCHEYVLYREPRWTAIKKRTTVTILESLLVHARQMKIPTVDICGDQNETGQIYYKSGRHVVTVAKLQQTDLQAFFDLVRSRVVIEEYYREDVYDGYLKIQNHNVAVHAYTSRGARRRHLTFHIGLISIYAVDAYAEDRARVLREFEERFIGPYHDREQARGLLLNYIFSVNDLANFNLQKFARQRNIPLGPSGGASVRRDAMSSCSGLNGSNYRQVLSV